MTASMLAGWGRTVAARIESGPLGRYTSPVIWQTLFLFAIETVANAIDYLFHAYLGRSLGPGSFAVVQTMNAAFLIVGTAVGVLQPVVARFVARSRGRGDPEGRRSAVFRLYFYQSLVAGAGLSAIVWAGRGLLGGWFNVPAAAVGVAAVAMTALLLRPVVNGMLQGRERFVLFGLTHAVFSSGRLALALALLGLLGMGALGGVAAMSGGAFLGLLAGLFFLGRSVWRRDVSLAPAESRALLRQGWALSVSAFVAYAAYMSLLNIDVIWTNRALPADLAGAYAGATVLRRVIAVLPGAVLTVLFPRVAAQIAQNRRPDRTLIKAAAAILLSTAGLTAAYYLLGPWIVRLFFGSGYEPAGALLGGMALGMMGAGLLAVWMNLFLASRPWPFVIVLAFLAGLQAMMFRLWGHTPEAVVLIFGLTTWLGALAGAALYFLWLRPALGDGAAASEGRV